MKIQIDTDSEQYSIEDIDTNYKIIFKKSVSYFSNIHALFDLFCREYSKYLKSIVKEEYTDDGSREKTS